VVVARLEVDDADSVRKAQRPPVRVADRLLHARDRTSREPLHDAAPAVRLPHRHAEREPAGLGVTVTALRASQLRRRRREDLPDRLVELRDAREARRERDVGERKRRRLDRHARSTRRQRKSPSPLGAVGDTAAVHTAQFVPPARHLLRARDLADARYSEPLGVDDLARAAGLSRAHFSREFRRAFGESPHAYLLTRRLERAAALLRRTDRTVAEICFSVGLQSVGSFTTSFTRMYGVSPTAYRAQFPPASAHAVVPECVVRFYGRPQNRTFRGDRRAAADLA
jgi:AraC-like DNA-binding protein